MDGSSIDADQRNAPISVDTYYIVPNKCTRNARGSMKSWCEFASGLLRADKPETVDELMARGQAPHLNSGSKVQKLK